MEIIFTKKAEKYIKKIEKKKRTQLLKEIHNLPNGDVKRMKGLKYTYRFKNNDYRVLFVKIDGKIKVTKVKPRGDVYNGY